MASGCGDVLSLEDLKTAKLHQIFEAEVITGKQGGVATGADIDYATNPITSQIQKTLPAVLRDAGFRPAPFTFTTGGTLSVGDSDVAVLWPVSDGGDGAYYIWKGAYPKTIPASSTPQSSGGVSNAAWSPMGDITLRKELADTSAVNKGDALIGVKQPFNGSAPLTVHDKMREVVSIKDGAGGVDSSGNTDCAAALTNIRAAGVASIVRFPFIPGTANIYFFSAFEPDNLGGITFDIDTGVVLSVPDDAMVGRPSSVNIGFVREASFFFRSINTYYRFAASRDFSFYEKGQFLSQVDYDYSSAQPVICNTKFTPLSVPFNSDTWASTPFTFVDDSQANFTVASGNNTLYYAAMALKPGDKLSAFMLQVATPYMLAVVRTTSGYYALKAFTTQDGSGLTIVFKRAGQNATETAVSFPMQGNHPAYSAVNSEWSIKINSFTSFDVCFNGFVVYSTSTMGFIIDAGFGGYFQSGISNATVNILNPVLTKNARVNASRFLAVKVFGDSVSSSRYDYWPGYLKKELEFASGVRAWNIIDSAVAGHTSSQQLALMQSQGVADANLVVIAVGTNDAQGQVDFTTYTSNLNAMLDICVNAGKPVVIAKFGLWYTQTQAGARGQLSANAEKAARYRGIVARVAAQRSVKLIDLTEIEGPIVAYYVNTAATINMVGAGDPAVHDNIHPTSVLTRLIGRRMAEAIMGSITTRNTFEVNSALIATANSGWVINANDNPVYADISHDGVLTLSGTVFRSSGTTTDATVIFILPKSMSPKANINIIVYSDQAATLKLIIGTDGTAKIYGWTSANSLAIPGISWNVK